MDRKILPHDVPSFVPDGAVYFVTVCSSPRGRNQLANHEAWTVLAESVRFYSIRRRWYARLVLAMPDHVHLLLSFPRNEPIRGLIASWKHYLAHRAGIVWQRDFFDHRLRSLESIDEKASYIRMNPVRAGLVRNSAEWPFIWVPSDSIALPT